ncbi:MAG: class I SAM-dependent methyltransferase [Candidatus Helarchaeota archaeon]
MRAWKADLYDSKSYVQFELGMKVMDMLKIKDGENILDIGCGTGRLTVEIAKRTPSGLVIGLDNNQEMINKAKDNLKKVSFSNIRYINENILDYKPEFQFHAIFSNSALHWILKTQDVFQKIFDILLPEGRVSAQMAAKGGMNEHMGLFLYPIKTLNLSKFYRDWQYPIQLINPKKLRRILDSIGFTDIEVQKVDQKIPFDSPEELIVFLRTAALVPILSQLPPAKIDEYLKCLLEIFREKDESILIVHMNRIFLKAKKNDQIGA